MATHSSVLALRIPGMGQPSGLPSMGSLRVGHDRSDLQLQLQGLGQIKYHSCLPGGGRLVGKRTTMRLEQDANRELKRDP